MTTELFYTHILSMKRGSLHTRSCWLGGFVKFLVAFEKRATIGPINRGSIAVLRMYFTLTRVTFTVVYLMKFSVEMFVSI